MDRIDLRSSFVTLVTRFENELGERKAEMMVEDFDSGEPVMAFENFVRGLGRANPEIDPDTRTIIAEVATYLDCLDYEPGKGLFW
jgi:Ca2+-binding EF-hand superfamily protein